MWTEVQEKVFPFTLLDPGVVSWMSKLFRQWWKILRTHMYVKYHLTVENLQESGLIGQLIWQHFEIWKLLIPTHTVRIFLVLIQNVKIWKLIMHIAHTKRIVLIHKLKENLTCVTEFMQWADILFMWSIGKTVEHLWRNLCSESGPHH